MTGRRGSATVLPSEGTAEQRWSRSFSLLQLDEGFDEKKPQGKDWISQSSDKQDLEPQQTAEAKAVVEPEPDLQQGGCKEAEEQER